MCVRACACVRAVRLSLDVSSEIQQHCPLFAPILRRLLLQQQTLPRPSLTSAALLSVSQTTAGQSQTNILGLERQQHS